jgi:DNA-binding LacI/PurR family transcriptional regulator
MWDFMPPIKRPTIYDVARQAGVSITTVSRVLNDPSKVNAKTRDRILTVIGTLGFVPKAEARPRSLRWTRRIGVITPFFTAPSFVQRLRGIAEALSTQNYELVIYTVDSTERLQSYLSSLPLTGNLDGLIILSLPVGDVEANRHVEHGLPTVLIEFPHPSLSSVEIDDLMGEHMAAQYLLKKGHRLIAFLGDTNLPEYSIHPVSQRLVGFRQGLQEVDVELPEAFIRLTPYSQEQTRQVAAELLSLPHPPAAIFPLPTSRPLAY